MQVNFYDLFLGENARFQGCGGHLTVHGLHLLDERQKREASFHPPDIKDRTQLSRRSSAHDYNILLDSHTAMCRPAAVGHRSKKTASAATQEEGLACTVPLKCTQLPVLMTLCTVTVLLSVVIMTFD